jgi:hypothetical protein
MVTDSADAVDHSRYFKSDYMNDFDREHFLSAEVSHD